MIWIFRRNSLTSVLRNLWTSIVVIILNSVVKTILLNLHGLQMLIALLDSLIMISWRKPLSFMWHRIICYRHYSTFCFHVARTSCQRIASAVVAHGCICPILNFGIHLLRSIHSLGAMYSTFVVPDLIKLVLFQSEFFFIIETSLQLIWLNCVSSTHLQGVVFCVLNSWN